MTKKMKGAHQAKKKKLLFIVRFVLNAIFFVFASHFFPNYQKKKKCFCVKVGNCKPDMYHLFELCTTAHEEGEKNRIKRHRSIHQKKRGEKSLS